MNGRAAWAAPARAAPAPYRDSVRRNPLAKVSALELADAPVLVDSRIIYQCLLSVQHGHRIFQPAGADYWRANPGWRGQGARHRRRQTHLRTGVPDFPLSRRFLAGPP